MSEEIEIKKTSPFAVNTRKNKVALLKSMGFEFWGLLRRQKVEKQRRITKDVRYQERREMTLGCGFTTCIQGSSLFFLLFSLLPLTNGGVCDILLIIKYFAVRFCLHILADEREVR